MWISFDTLTWLSVNWNQPQVSRHAALLTQKRGVLWRRPKFYEGSDLTTSIKVGKKFEDK
jgi:hypothetical protein